MHRADRDVAARRQRSVPRIRTWMRPRPNRNQPARRMSTRYRRGRRAGRAAEPVDALERRVVETVGQTLRLPARSMVRRRRRSGVPDAHAQRGPKADARLAVRIFRLMSARRLSSGDASPRPGLALESAAVRCCLRGRWPPARRRRLRCQSDGRAAHPSTPMATAGASRSGIELDVAEPARRGAAHPRLRRTSHQDARQGPTAPDGRGSWIWKGRDGSGARVPFGPYRVKATVRTVGAILKRATWVTRATTGAVSGPPRGGPRRHRSRARWAGGRAPCGRVSRRTTSTSTSACDSRPCSRAPASTWS